MVTNLRRCEPRSEFMKKVFIFLEYQILDPWCQVLPDEPLWTIVSVVFGWVFI